MLNPQLDHSRRIGAPISSSPLGNRGQFRPPTIKRPAGGDGTVRVPLEDVSNAPLGAGGGMGGGGLGVKGPDLKRQRTS
jgi:DNA repair and recombination protein RAD52